MNRIQIIYPSIVDFDRSISPSCTEIDKINHTKSLINPDTVKCHGCGCVGNCKVSISYKRSFITPENYQSHDPDASLITIDCLYCKICDYTHANLYDPIVPYSRHSLRFIMRVLYDYTKHMLSSKDNSLTVEKICQKWYISVSTLYRWKNRFSHHYQLWCAAICLKEKMNEQLDQVFQSKGSTCEFFQKTSFSFLQPNKKTHAHRIPGLCRDMPPPDKYYGNVHPFSVVL